MSQFFVSGGQIIEASHPRPGAVTLRCHPEPETRDRGWKKPPTPKARARSWEEQPEKRWLHRRRRA